MIAVGVGFLCLAVISKVDGRFYKTNLTDFSKCKTHYSRSETKYGTFYQIPDEDRQNDMLLDFHFSVIATRDAHILFASEVQDQLGSVYEIVLGAGSNTFAEIRRAQKTAGKASVRIKGLVSAVDIHSFWFHISSDGLLEVGRETEELAFLSWRDPDPIPVRVFSLNSWRGVEAKWYFDCPRENFTSDSTEIEPVLTDLQRLHKVLLTDYHTFVRPVLVESDRTLVTMDLVPMYISLDEHRGILDLKGDGKLYWMDEKLVWNPDDFGGIDKLIIPSYRIWNPDIVLYTSVETNSNLFGATTAVVSNFGTVEVTSYFHLQSWCDAGSLGTWPSDNHTCNLEFGFWREIFNVQLQFSSNRSDHLKHQTASEWNIHKLEQVVNYGWRNNTYADPPGLFLRFTLTRQSNIYKLIYFTPFLVISILMLATFWVSPLDHLKITLGCIELVLSCAILIHLASTIPGHPDQVPNLLLLYSSSLIAIVISIGISILVINIARVEHRQNLPHILRKILTSPLTQLVLFLPIVKDPNEYGKLNGALLPVSCTSVQVMWILFATAIDRLTFLVYLILWIFAISVKY